MWAAFIMQEFPMIIVLMNEIAFDSEHDATNTQSFRQAPYQSQHPLWLCEWAGRSVFIVVGGWKVYNFIQSAPEKVFAFNLVLLTFLSLYLSYCIYPSSWYRSWVVPTHHQLMVYPINSSTYASPTVSVNC